MRSCLNDTRLVGTTFSSAWVSASCVSAAARCSVLSVSHTVCGHCRMAERKRSHVWSYFSSTNSQDAVCDVCRKTIRSCGNTTNLVKHLRLNHTSEYEAYTTMRQTEEESSVSASGAAARARQTCLAESFRATGRHYPGTEWENVEL